MCSVAVLMSTFNGEQFIVDQLDSIIAEVPLAKFYIRDDGSDDRTIEIFRAYFENRKENLAYFEFGTGNLGPAGSFFKLLKLVREDYIFLADQDDVWIEGRALMLLDKIRLVESSAKENTPALVFSDVQVVDKDLSIIDSSFWHFESNFPYSRMKLSNVIVQNRAPGCSMILNNSLARLVGENIKNAIMHDWWLLLLAMTFGRVDYCANPTLKYRQHGSNTVGAKKVGWGLNDFIKNVKKSNLSIEKTVRQASSFLQTYPNMPCEHKLVFENYIMLSDMNIFSRKFGLLGQGYLKSSFYRNIGFFILF